MDLQRAYEILSLPYGSSLDEVKKAFHAEAQIHHPDRFGNASPEVKRRAEERFKLVNEAYHTITDYFEQYGEVRTPLQRPAKRAPKKPTPPSEKTPEEIEQEILMGRMRSDMDKEVDSMTKNIWILLILMVFVFFFAMASLKSCMTESPRVEQE